MNNTSIENKLTIGVLFTILIIIPLLILNYKSKRKKSINEKIFGSIFVRTLCMLFPAILITARDIIEFSIILVGIIFGALLNTQYITKKFKSNKENEK